MRQHFFELDSEEQANVITHVLGLLLAVVVAMLCIHVSMVHGGTMRITAATVFGISLMAVYFTSTTYHFMSDTVRAKFWKVLDHLAIYLLIAGTYTPILLLRLTPVWGWSVLTVIWALAFLGMWTKLARFRTGEKFGWSDTSLYVFMGWVGIVAFVPIVRGIDMPGIALILAGGLCYTFGCVFFLWDKLRFNHAIWHVFVLAGSACHAIAVLGWVLPV
ncbi:MAG: hemolysin III family protein [Planctomycetota bacterium]